MAQQIRNGFNRAWVTIFDSHVTIFLSGLVLYSVGTEEVKGFALTLIIGMIWNLFTAVYVSRVIFDYWYARGWLKQLTMLKMFDKTNFDFISPRKMCMAGSVGRDRPRAGRGPPRNGMYNIDFTGGTLVTIRLNDQDPEVKGLTESARANFVRTTARRLPDVTVESLNVGGETSGARYNIRTTEKEIEKVKQAVLEAFGEALQRVELRRPGGPDGRRARAGPEPAGRRGQGRGPRPGRPLRRGPAIRPHLQLPPVRRRRSPKSFGTSWRPGSPTPTPGSRSSTRRPTRRRDGGRLEDPDSPDRPRPDAAQAQLTKLGHGPPVRPEPALRAVRDVRQHRGRRDPDPGGDRHVASWLIIAGYLWFRFKSFSYGLAAIIAVIHDVLVTLGAVAITYWLAMIPGFREFLLIDPYKIDLPMIAAFLTLIGFSVNDTIVIFDRIREIKGKTPDPHRQMINDAVNQTLSRTILTSLTAWLVVVILYIFGGEGLHGFAFALAVGFLSGTYSTDLHRQPDPDRLGPQGHPSARHRQGKLVTSRMSVNAPTQKRPPAGPAGGLFCFER